LRNYTGPRPDAHDVRLRAVGGDTHEALLGGHTRSDGDGHPPHRMPYHDGPNGRANRNSDG
jgi:hypothetical protein